MDFCIACENRPKSRSSYIDRVSLCVRADAAAKTFWLTQKYFLKNRRRRMQATGYQEATPASWYFGSAGGCLDYYYTNSIFAISNESIIAINSYMRVYCIHPHVADKEIIKPLLRCIKWISKMLRIFPVFSPPIKFQSQKMKLKIVCTSSVGQKLRHFFFLSRLKNSLSQSYS